MLNKLTDEQKQVKLDKKVLPLVFNKDIVINSLGDVLQELFYNQRCGYTYHISKSGKYIPQHTGNMRSIEDCYLIAKYYIKDISYKNVKEAVQSLYKDYLCNSWCNTVNKRVHSTYRQLDRITINNILDNYKLNISNK